MTADYRVDAAPWAERRLSNAVKFFDPTFDFLGPKYGAAVKTAASLARENFFAMPDRMRMRGNDFQCHRAGRRLAAERMPAYGRSICDDVVHCNLQR